MEWLTEPFALGFQQRALLGGILAAVLSSVVGTWVVIRGMAFLGDALVHGVIPGIALAVLLGWNVLLGASLAALVMIGGINLVHRQTVFSEDTGIGLLFAGMLGLGVILISRTPSYSSQLSNVLFGNVLGVTGGDIAALAAVLATVTIASGLFYRAFLVLAFNERQARLLGMRPALANAVLLGMITLSIVGAFRTVGTLLVFGLLVGPPATAALLVRRVPAMIATGALIGAVSVTAGLIISYYAGTAGSATMAAVPVLLFFITLAVVNLLAKRTRRGNCARPAEARSGGAEGGA